MISARFGALSIGVMVLGYTGQSQANGK